MLTTVLNAVAAHEEAVSLARLSRELQIEPGALEGMLDFWVRKGRVRRATVVDCSHCLLSCQDDAGCPLVASLPVTYASTRDRRR